MTHPLMRIPLMKILTPLVTHQMVMNLMLKWADGFSLFEVENLVSTAFLIAIQISYDFMLEITDNIYINFSLFMPKCQVKSHRGKGCTWVAGTWFFTPAELEKLQLSLQRATSRNISKILTSLANPINFSEIKPSSTSWEKQRLWQQTIEVSLMQGALKVG